MNNLDEIKDKITLLEGEITKINSSLEKIINLLENKNTKSLLIDNLKSNSTL